MPKKKVIQEHHICYRPEIKAPMFKGEHLIITKMHWYCRKNVSVGFITALKVFIALNEHRAKEVKPK